MDEEYEDWLERTRGTEEIAAVTRILRRVLPKIPLACTCSGGSCDRCRLDRFASERLADDRQVGEWFGRLEDFFGSADACTEAEARGLARKVANALNKDQLRQLG